MSNDKPGAHPMSAHGPGEVLVRLSREEAEECRERTLMLRSDEKIVAALDAHDAAQNPLGLPWRSAGNSEGRASWYTVHSVSGEIIAGRMRNISKAEAELMAAAPELADALEEWLVLFRNHGGYPEEKHASTSALTKAGRR